MRAAVLAAVWRRDAPNVQALAAGYMKGMVIYDIVQHCDYAGFVWAFEQGLILPDSEALAANIYAQSEQARQSSLCLPEPEIKLRYLIAAKADVNGLISSSYGPMLDYAINHESYNPIGQLLKAGASITAKTADRISAHYTPGKQRCSRTIAALLCARFRRHSGWPRDLVLMLGHLVWEERYSLCWLSAAEAEASGRTE